MSATYCFSVHTDAEPSALPRVMEVFARLGHVPARCHVERASHAAPELVIDAQLDALARSEAEHVARCLDRVVSVIQVLWSEKRRHAA
jgi:acetolactate synthase small subunit